jgi:hypothetical protein
MHPIYDDVTFLSAVGTIIDIATLVFGYWPFVADAVGQIANFVKVSLLLLSTNEGNVCKELATYGAGELIGAAVADKFEKTPIIWAYNMVSLFDGLGDIVDSICNENNYCDKIIDYCCNIESHDVFLELKNGDLCKTKDIKNALEKMYE